MRKTLLLAAALFAAPALAQTTAGPCQPPDRLSRLPETDRRRRAAAR
ncbi:hypothetical protein [Sphingopyxis sp. PET50]|nr:hypothetical protein [Sphingopyxis sp. PET50]